MQHRDRFLAGTTLREIHVFSAIMEHILGKYGNALGMAKDIEIFLEIRFLWSGEQAYLLTCRRCGQLSPPEAMPPSA